MDTQKASHMREEAPSRKEPGPFRRAAVTVLLSAVGALLLEAGTLCGSFAHNALDPSAWVLKRVAVFFVLLIPLTLWAQHVLGRRHRSEQQVIVPVRRVALSACAVAGGVAVALLVGPQLAHAMGGSNDWRYTVACASVLVACLLVAINFEAVVRSLEWAYLALALCMGTAFCLFMPTCAEVSWDGQIHFDAANALSYVLNAEYTGADALMTEAGLPGALYLTGDLGSTEEFEVELGSRTVSFPQASLRLDAIEAADEALRTAEATQPLLRLQGTAQKSGDSYLNANSLGHVPNAIGLWIGRLLHVDCSVRYTLSRMCNTLFYVVVFFFAIRALKRGKLIMAAIGLAPTPLLEAANFSYDPWIVCLLSLSLGLFVGKLQSEGELAPHDSFVCLVPFVLGACVRAIVFPLALVFLVVPRRRFASSKAWAAHLALILAALLLLLGSFAIPYVVSLSSGVPQGDMRGGNDVNGGSQIAYVLSHPLQTLQMGLTFAARMLNPLNLGLALDPSDENLLYYFPYLITTTAPLNELLAATEFALLVAVSLLDGGPEDERYAAARYKVGALVGTGLAFALVCGSMYVAFTAVGRDTIAGVQQRYLLSLLAAFFLFVPNVAFRRKPGRTWLAPGFVVVETVMLSLVLWNTFVWAF